MTNRRPNGTQNRKQEDDELPARLRTSIARLSRVLRRHHEFGITPTESAMLAQIAWEGEPTLGSLASSEHVAPPTVTRAINSLEANGLVERLPDPNDRRVCRVRLSAAGETIANAYRTQVNAWLAGQLQGLSHAERNQLEAAVCILERFVKVGQAEQESS